ncbi:MAG: ABC transporter ATP-binding protein/permease [Clostridia bacterium]|nr:ABC transporter ATP-binding protein/permease [Clostridia bacterium]
MLKLTNIVKEYPTGDEKVVALKGVDIEFRKSEFVSILGHSGCGKTTLLNIIGGLDQYTDGDLIIKGKSTKSFKDRDWDTYRNHSVGFVFQNYNLIPHQSVLSNVELALTLSGVSKAERKQRAKAALESVGLGDQINKKPNQMSGGQMQRVAIARALVNNPEILLADEPTGALDSETSVQIMKILKEISKDRLVIMVTHNPELADEYSTRIIRLVDGRVVNDSMPYDSSAEVAQEEKTEKLSKREAKKKAKKTSMSFATALSLSLNNLMTKKVRTFLTSFAGSIGIIGIALILALSNGFQLYIDSIQKEALTSYPVMVESATMDMNAMMGSMTGATVGEVNHGLDKVYSNTMAAGMMESFTGGIWVNDLAGFKQYLESGESQIKNYSSSIQYTYGGKLNIYSADTSAGLNQVYPSPIVGMANSMMGGMSVGMGGISMENPSMETYMNKYLNSWMELIDNQKLLEEQYEVVSGAWPKNYNEVVLIVDKNNEISDIAIQGLGLSTTEEMMESFMAMQSGEEYTPKSYEIEYDEIIGKKFRLVLEPDYFDYDEATSTWVDKHGDEEHVKQLVENGEEIKIVGIVRPADGSLMVVTTGAIGYTVGLTEHIINKTNECEIVKQQKANPEVDVFTGLPFVKEEVAPEAAAPETAPAASEVSLDPQLPSGEAPEVSSMAFKGETPVAKATALSEDEIFALIDETYSGQQREDMRRMVTLFLQSKRTDSEKAELVSLLPETMAIPGMGDMPASQAVDMIGSIPTKSMKLDILTGMINGDYGPVIPPPEGGDVTDPEAPVAPEEPEVPEEPEPQPYAKDYNDAISILGVADLNSPTSISIFPVDFEAKDMISADIESYNQKMEAAGKPNSSIKYTDYIGLLLSSVTKIVNVISYVLIAFVAISLVVSSLMIGIITYISVLERTKEIGILRAIGASKKDISSVFNAETLIVGFVSGAIGIGTTLLLTIPINAVIEHLTKISDVAQLPTNGAIILVVISMVLTFIAGLIPSRIASKKDPVVALRSE